jgi:hypothetical protein
MDLFFYSCHKADGQDTEYWRLLDKERNQIKRISMASFVPSVCLGILGTTISVENSY